ncbi:hypothetical protein MNQ98_15685 [Paenibacillus sp. N3/727]|uniref:hypothetical protein n=1 Tax=Paenibacillus sp. N3/727 TaxID=2925845 RepID=UPI001F53A45B|nr:hypothetical protein [Paenibacillus sp. N3/727]UNK15993.1 hypothetical protein MNQ98_15685 [Paenibacillus sp. N3/727]
MKRWRASAGGLSQTSSEFGFALGFAVLGSISTAVYRIRMTNSIPQEIPNGASLIAQDNIAGTTEVTQDIPNQLEKGAHTLYAAELPFIGYSESFYEQS